MTCRHCEAEATKRDPNDLDEGDSFRCESCGILGTVYQGDRDVDHGEDGGVYAVAFLGFRPNDGERCTWDGCEECPKENVNA